MKKLRIGVVGVGHLGSKHARIYKDMADVELAGVCDIDFKRAKDIGEALKVESFDSHKKLFDRVDAVSIVVPTDSHYEVTRNFLKNGVHTLVEKPVTRTVDEAEELLILSREKGLVLQVGHVERFNAAVIALEKLVTIPRFIEAHRLSPYLSRGIEVGVVLDLMIHDLDIILRIVKATVSKIDALGVSILTPFEDIANVRLSFSNGAVANITASRVSEEKMRKIRIFQDDAYISLDYIEQKFSVFRKKENKIFKEEVVLEKTEPLREELKDFVRCVREGRSPRVPGEQAKEALELALEVTHKIQGKMDNGEVHKGTVPILRASRRKSWDSPQHIMLIAGEASGDRHGANLMKSLKIRRGSGMEFQKETPTTENHIKVIAERFSCDIRFTGLGGQLMREEGQEQLYDIKELAVLGLTEVLKRIFFFKKVFEETLDFIEKEKPDALVLVDYPGFNVRLAERLARTARARKSGRGKIIYYISPQVWAWGKGRVEKIGRAIDRMLVIFPFEEQIYASKLIPVSFVGHPLLDELKDIPQKNEARKKIGLAEQDAVIGILPGSRRQEIGLILPIMLKAAQLLKNKFNAKFLIPLAPGVDRPVVENGLMKQGLRQDYKAGIFKIVEGETPAAISASDLIITASGTATLETAILERPMVIVYKVPFLTYLVLRRIIKLDSIGMVNILLNEKAFPEFIQYNARPDEIFKACSRILEEKDLRENMLCNLKKVKSLLGTPGAGINAANQIWGMIDE